MLLSSITVGLREMRVGWWLQPTHIVQIRGLITLVEVRRADTTGAAAWCAVSEYKVLSDTTTTGGSTTAGRGVTTTATAGSVAALIFGSLAPTTAFSGFRSFSRPSINSCLLPFVGRPSFLHISLSCL
ncbi:hypothetical protein Mapa_011102 [Marchantia paleacea]|nr:hypothetical protein Mapa_011102 [Marchantia paleacea]